MEVFTKTSFPSTISCDNGSNFSAQLSKELYRMLGIQVRFSSPMHPESQGMVERFNQVLKKLLHHIICSSEAKSWHLKIKYLLASYREIPNRITGLSPYQLVYGKVGRGPMSVIKHIWMREHENLEREQINLDDYLMKLQQDLVTAAEIANENCDKNQKKYVDYYNKWARDKSFSVNDKVIVLLKDSTNKLKSRWTGPCTITEILTENSYRVLMPNGGIRNFHANHLRRYKCRVNTMGVLYEGDEDLGNIHYFEAADKNISKIKEIENLDLSHLNEDQSKQVKQLLIKYLDVFNDNPGNCNLYQHEINLKEGFVPKKQVPYRIPEKLKEEVNRQIDELLQ